MWQQLAVVGLCLLFVLGALGAGAWAVITGQIGKQGIDALFLLFVCLLVALIFAPIPVQALRQGLLQQALKRSKGGKTEKGVEPSASQTEDNAKQHSAS